MTRIMKIGDIILDYDLFIEEEYNTTNNTQGKAFKTLSGGLIVYEKVKRINTQYITLISKDSGWQKEETVKNILLLLDDIDIETTITNKLGIITQVRPAVEKGAIISVSDAVNEDGKWLKVTIRLCRI